MFSEDSEFRRIAPGFFGAAETPRVRTAGVIDHEVRLTGPVLASGLQVDPVRARFPLTNGSVHHQAPPSYALVWGSRRGS